MCTLLYTCISVRKCGHPFIKRSHLCFIQRTTFCHWVSELSGVVATHRVSSVTAWSSWTPCVTDWSRNSTWVVNVWWSAQYGILFFYISYFLTGHFILRSRIVISKVLHWVSASVVHFVYVGTGPRPGTGGEGIHRGRAVCHSHKSWWRAAYCH